MKKLKYIICLLLIVTCGIFQQGFCQQNILSGGDISPVGTHCDGDLVTVRYSMGITMHQDSAAQIHITYDDNYFDFLSTNISTSTTGMFTIISNTTGDLVIRSHVFNSTDNNYSYLADFTLTFRVVSSGCVPSAIKDITAILSSIYLPNMAEDNITAPVVSSVDIQNCAATNSLTMELYKGSDCGLAIYKISSYGYESASSISHFKCTLPNGATMLNVYNSSGNDVSFIQTGNMATWFRSGINAETWQVHYIVVSFNPAAMCANPQTNSISLNFNSTQICDPVTPVTSTVSRPLNCCGSGGTSTGGLGGTPGAVVIPESSPGANNGGIVLLTKTLVQTPFRYFPKPNNCQTHDYYITVDNFTNQYLKKFQLTDDLEAIIHGITSEIRLKDISLKLSPLFASGINTNFTCDVNTVRSTPPSLLATLSSTAVTAHALSSAGWSPSIGLPETNVDLIGNGIFKDFPPKSSITLKLTHYLEDPHATVTDIYDNTAKLRFDLGSNTYHTSADWKSKIDTYAPILKIEKFVRDSTTNGPFSKCVAANPGDTMQFLIKIRNYGITDALNVVFNDYIDNPYSSFYAPYLLTTPAAMAFSVTDANGTYSQTELDYIKNSLVQSIGAMTNNMFNMVIPNVKAAPCLGYSELLISYYVIIKSPSLITCDSVYTNTAFLKWSWENDTWTDKSAACVNIDLFKNISNKIEYSCGPNGPWSTMPFNAFPGQHIYYKASVRNYNAYAVNNYKMIVQLPNGTSNSSTQKDINNYLNSETPATPSGTGLYPTSTPIFSPGFTYSNVTNNLEDNWLAGTIMPAQLALPAPAHTKSLIGKIDLPAYTGSSSPEFSVTYDVIVPVNNPGSYYTTKMGVSLFTNTGGCNLVKKDSLKMTISDQPTCGTTPTGCDFIKFDTLITKLPGKILKVQIFNILDMNAASPNFNTIDVVVHTPYNSCINITPGVVYPYNKPIINYVLLTNPVVTSSPYTHTNPTIGERIITFNNNSTAGTFGSITFYVQLSTMPKASCGMLPINIVFKDNNTPCTLCEKTIYLKF